MSAFFNRIRTSEWAVRLTGALAAAFNFLYRTKPAVRRRTEQNRAAVAAYEKSREEMRLINGQALGGIAPLPFGKSTMAHSGCAVIAVYNALLILGRPRPLADIAAELERRGIVLGGAFGVYPAAADAFFRRESFEVRSVYGSAARDESACDAAFADKKAAVLTAWNSVTVRDGRGGLVGAHTVAIAHAPGGVAVYNAHDRAEKPLFFPSVAEYIRQGGLLPILFTAIDCRTAL